MDLKKHLRNTFLAGVFAAIPLAATIFVVWYVESTLRHLTGLNIPFAGVALAVVAIYLLGLFVSSLLGRMFLNLLDRALQRLPMFRELYQAWKQVALSSDGGEGMFAKVVLIPDAGGKGRQMGFTNGMPASADNPAWCVFVPAAPNPTSGRLVLIDPAHVQITDVSTEDAFKMILSGGNFLPTELG